VAGTWTVPLPAGPYNFPANYTANGGWWATNSQQDPRTYQVARAFPSTWCGGKPVHVVNNGESYSGRLESSNNTTSVFHIQLHTAVPASNHSANVDCTAASGQNPSPGTKACDFGWNGDVDNLVAAAYTGSGSNSGSNAGSGSGSGGSGSGPGSGGSAAAGGAGAIPVPATGAASQTVLGLAGAALGAAACGAALAGRRRGRS
jgi:LPXTG-motif cell wall-anchored protein